MNDRLQKHLEATGRANPDRIGRALKPRTCTTCGHPTLTGLDDDVAALPIHVDTTPLTPLGEACAALQNVTTYQVVGHPAGLVATARRPSTITAYPAGTVPVLPEHHCTIRYPPQALQANPATGTPDLNDPPF